MSFYLRSMYHNKNADMEHVLKALDSPDEYGAVTSTQVLKERLRKKTAYVYYDNVTSCRESLGNYVHSAAHSMVLSKVVFRIAMGGGATNSSIAAINKSPSGYRFLKWIGDLAGSFTGNSYAKIQPNSIVTYIVNAEKGVSKYDLSIAMWILRVASLVKAVVPNITPEMSDDEIAKLVITNMLYLAVNRPSSYEDGGYSCQADFVLLAMALWCRKQMNKEYRTMIDSSNGPINALFSKDSWHTINFAKFVQTFLKDKDFRKDVRHIAGRMSDRADLALGAATHGKSRKQWVTAQADRAVAEIRKQRAQKE